MLTHNLEKVVSDYLELISRGTSRGWCVSFSYHNELTARECRWCGVFQHGDDPCILFGDISDRFLFCEKCFREEIVDKISTDNLKRWILRHNPPRHETSGIHYLMKELAARTAKETTNVTTMVVR